MFDTLRDNSRIIVYIVVVAFVVSGGFMGFGAYLSNRGGGANPQQSSGVIAEVNDKEISQEEYFSLLQQQAPQSNLNSRQIIPFRYNVLDVLIERKLVMSEAEAVDLKVEVSEAEIDENYNNILEQNQITDQELAENLAEQGYTIGQLRDDIKSSLENNKLIRETINQGIGEITIKEEEVKALYQQRYPAEQNSENEDSAESLDSEAEAAETRPDLKEVEDNLRAEIRNQKSNQAANKWMQSLKAEAEIIINEPVLSAYHALEKENYDQAAEEFAVFINEEGTDPIFYSYLAQAYEGQENYEKAEKTYEDAVDNYPENIDLRFNFAQYLTRREENEAAIKQLDKASDFAEDDFMSYYQLFMMYSQLEAEDKAELAMQKIQELSEEVQNSSERPTAENREEIKEEVEEIEEQLEVDNNLDQNN